MIAQFFKKEISYIIKSPNTHCTTTLLFKMADDMSVGETSAVMRAGLLPCGHKDPTDCQDNFQLDGQRHDTELACIEHFMRYYKRCRGYSLTKVYGAIYGHLKHCGFEPPQDMQGIDAQEDLIEKVYNST